jgi:hypothetical protein
MPEDIIIETAYDVLNKYGQDLSVALRENLIKNKNFATGGLADSIHFRVVVLPQSASFELYMADYWKYVDAGRGPTKGAKGGNGFISEKKLMQLDWSNKTLRGKLLTWINRKGLTQSLAHGKGKNPSAGKVSTLTDLVATRMMAFRMSRKIHRSGYVGKGFFTNAMKGGEAGDIKQLERELAAILGNKIRVTLIETT